MCGLPASHTFLTPMCGARFPSYETRSSGYRPHTVLRSSASSLQNLTGKRSLTYSIAPFMVQLFTVGRLNRSPRWSHPGAACHQTTAPHASRVERTSLAGPDPMDGILTRFACRAFAAETNCMLQFVTDTASLIEHLQRGFSASPVFCRFPQIATTQESTAFRRIG